MRSFVATAKRLQLARYFIIEPFSRFVSWIRNRLAQLAGGVQPGAVTLYKKNQMLWLLSIIKYGIAGNEWGRILILVLLPTSWRRGSKDSRGQGFKGLFSKDFISAFNILSIAAISLNRVRMTFARLSTLCIFLAFHLNP